MVKIIELMNIFIKENRKCHKSCKMKSIIETGNIPIIIKIEENLSFEQANNLEIKYISLLGRIDKGTGILTNHTDGGQGTKNKILSKETKRVCNGSRKSAGGYKWIYEEDYKSV